MRTLRKKEAQIKRKQSPSERTRVQSQHFKGCCREGPGLEIQEPIPVLLESTGPSATTHFCTWVSSQFKEGAAGGGERKPLAERPERLPPPRSRTGCRAAWEPLTLPPGDPTWQLGGGEHASFLEQPLPSAPAPISRGGPEPRGQGRSDTSAEGTCTALPSELP